LKWKVALGIVLIAALITAYWLYQNRSEAIYQRVVNQDGYTLSLVKENISAEFFLKPEWIPERNGEERLLNLVIEEKFDTEIILEKVAKRENDFYIQLNLVPHPNRTSGQLLSTSLIEGGTFTTGGMNWQVTNTAGEDLLQDGFGTGGGPGNLSFLFVEDKDREKFVQGAVIRYSSYYLYGYRQLPGEYAEFWLPTLFTVLLIVLLAVIYRKRSDQENGLALKLIGYLLLGGFTFSLNNVRLPLGFAVYWVFFRKPKPNHDIKHKAALLGLLLYLLQLTMPGIVNVLDLKDKNIAINHVSIEQLGVDGLWKMIEARAPISDQAKILNFETVVSSDGEVKELDFSLVDRDDHGRYILTKAVYDSAKNSVALKRSWSDEWLQYPRQTHAEDFFEKVNSFDLMDLKPFGGDHQLVKLELLQDGTRVNYAIKDAQTFGVNEEGISKIELEQLPVEGIWMMACGVPQIDNPAHGCDNPTHYLFDFITRADAS
jgi:hypothetical protein